MFSFLAIQSMRLSGFYWFVVLAVGVVLLEPMPHTNILNKLEWIVSFVVPLAHSICRGNS
jgi:hypothetical protein